MARRDVEIRVRGVVPMDVAERLGMRVASAPADTVLRGMLPDLAALHGLLDRLRTNGVELIDVRRLPAPGGDDVPSAT